MDRPGWGSQPAAKSPLIRRIKKVRLHFRSFVRSFERGCGMRGWRTNFALSLVLLRAPPLPPSLAPLAFLISAELIKVFARVSMTCCPCPPHSASAAFPRRFAIWPLSGVLRGGRRQRVRQWKDFYACLAHATFFEILSIRCLPSKRERPTCCPPAPPRTFTHSLSLSPSSPSPECRKSSLPLSPLRSALLKL